MNSPAYQPPTLTLYEPRTEGHHLAWLGLITEDLCAAGFRLTLAVDLRPGTETRLRDHLGKFYDEVAWFNAYDANVNPMLANQICATSYQPGDVTTADASPGQLVTAHGTCAPHRPFTGP